jgi:hypothetical protein
MVKGQTKRHAECCEKAAGMFPLSATERQILTNGIIALAVLLLLQFALAKFLYPRFDYQDKYLLPLLYLPIVIVTNIIAIWHQRAHRVDVGLMTGMMIGMTIGMTSGFTVGAIVGLTNGMFIGALTGMLVGIGAGAYAGKCCGTMGIMEGMMAGLMSGTMGAMLTVMLVADHVQLFLPILIGICVIILAGLMRVVVEEHHGKTVEISAWPLRLVLGISLLLMLAISLVIVLAPKGLY